MRWARWFETWNRRVASTHIAHIHISTVFLGLDHSFGDGLPLLFDTMIFDGMDDEYQTRCSTWDEALVQHQEAVAKVLNDGIQKVSEFWHEQLGGEDE